MNIFKLNSNIVLIYILLILMVIFWGFSFVIVHIAIDYIPALSIALYRLVVASFSFFIIDIYQKFKKKSVLKESQLNLQLNHKPPKHFWILIILASSLFIILSGIFARLA